MRDLTINNFSLFDEPIWSLFAFYPRKGQQLLRFTGIKSKGTFMRTNSIVPAIAGLAISVALQAPGFASEHEVLGVYVNSGDLNKLQVPPGTETTFDSTTIHCPRETCTLALSAMLEIHSADYQGEWGIVAMVDGQYVDSPYGPYQGYEPIAKHSVLSNAA